MAIGQTININIIFFAAPRVSTKMCFQHTDSGIQSTITTYLHSLDRGIPHFSLKNTLFCHLKGQLFKTVTLKRAFLHIAFSYPKIIFFYFVLYYNFSIMNKYLLAFAIFNASSVHAQLVIPLYNGTAPGSETWTWSEKAIKVGNSQILMDITNPALIAFIPANPNGTAIIIAPGGGFHRLTFTSEGTEAAKWLADRGITGFVLKYRLYHEDSTLPENSLLKILQKGDLKRLDSVNAAVLPLALQDGLTAVRYVRQHAAKYHIDTSKIGFMGFSAGGTLTMSVVYSSTGESRPNFVAPIYAYENEIIGSDVPSAKTPIFIVAASDDNLGLATNSVHIYLKWLAANQPAELHQYERGGHGFGMDKQNIPVDTWIDRFFDWLQAHGLAK
jgi:acetyl esterase/lipase